jgi:uncharacterized protein involved in type VI secretion and phage assembly
VAFKTIANERYDERAERGKAYGVWVGIVTDNKDPEGKYRIKVRFPAQDNGDASGENSFWCRVCTVGAGKSRGIFFLPEVDDEVMVGFEHGEISHPYVLGTVYNSNQTATHDNKGGKNDIRQMTSRSGHKLSMNDGSTTSCELTSTGGHTLSLDDGGTVLLSHSSKSEFWKANGGNINMEAATDINIKAGSTLKIDAATIKITSSGDTTMKAANWSTKADSTFKLEAGSTGTVKSGSTLTIKGSVVNIN